MNRYARNAALENSARDQLIFEHADMARRIALRVGRNVPHWITKDDLVATAMVGLAEAADRFDPAEGRPFVAFAERRIRGAVFDELRRGDILPRRVRMQAREIGRTIKELEHELGREPEDAEIARSLGVDEETYTRELSRLTQISFVELDPEHSSLSTHQEASPLGAAEKSEMLRRLRAAYDSLPERDLRLLSLYYLEEFTYGEIGGILGVSESRVCQLHARALARLKAQLDPVHGGARA